MRDSKGRFVKGCQINLGRKRPDAQRRFKKIMDEWWRQNPDAHNRAGNPAWKGGTSYKVCKETWEEYWHEGVPKGCVIHHFDRNRKNNIITNLVLATRSWHQRLHRQVITPNGGENSVH